MAEAPFPEQVRALFWDVDPATVSFREHAGFIYSRVLGSGHLDAAQWLRAHQGDEALRSWLLRTHGRSLSPRQLRLWETILQLPHDEVSAWIAEPGRQLWDRRAS